MKSAFDPRPLCRFATIVAFALAALLGPTVGSAGTPTQPQPKPEQEQPQPKPEQPIQEEAREFTKTIKREFPITADGLVGLSNKYGRVEVHTWDRNRVKIDVNIVVEARSESAAQEVFDRINIDFSNGDAFVNATTVIQSKNSWWGDWGSTKSEFQVNYDVYMPATCNIKLGNQYGDATVAAITGNADVDVKYGNFQLDGVDGNLKVYLGYGNGTVTKARDVSAFVSYSKLNFSNAQDIVFDSKYSKIYVDKGASIKATSKYDQFNLAKITRFNCESRYGNMEIGDAETVIANAQYTDYKVEKLRESADFDIEYGGLRVNDLSKGFSTVVLNGKYADFKIYVEPGSSFSLDGASNYAAIAYPTEMKVVFEKDKGTSHEVKGHIGTQGARSTIKANLNYGGLRVRHRE